MICELFNIFKYFRQIKRYRQVMNNPFFCKILLKTSIFNDFLEIICKIEMVRDGRLEKIKKRRTKRALFSTIMTGFGSTGCTHQA